MFQILFKIFICCFPSLLYVSLTPWSFIKEEIIPEAWNEKVFWSLKWLDDCMKASHWIWWHIRIWPTKTPFSMHDDGTLGATAVSTFFEDAKHFWRRIFPEFPQCLPCKVAPVLQKHAQGEPVVESLWKFDHLIGRVILWISETS